MGLPEPVRACPVCAKPVSACPVCGTLVRVRHADEAHEDREAAAELGERVLAYLAVTTGEEPFAQPGRDDAWDGVRAAADRLLVLRDLDLRRPAGRSDEEGR